MWSRLSLRVQIVLILVAVLGAEAALSATWMALVLRKSFAQQNQLDRELWLGELAMELEARCGEAPVVECVLPRVERARAAAGFQGLQVRWPLGRVSVGDSDLHPGVAATATVVGAWHLNGVASNDDASRRAANVIQFHLANLAVLVLGLTGLGAVLFNRAVARPVDQLSTIADRIGHLELDGSMTSADAPMLGQLGTAFERMGRALRAEQSRTATQISELTRINRELKDARDSLVRQEKLATVGRLAAGVAHEVGNPLGGILGYAELLKLRSDPSVQEYGERIGREVARIDRTVRGLLDYSRPADTELIPLALPAVVQAALGLCHADKRFRSVEAHLDLPADLPSVIADEHRLSQVLVNLLLNAGDAMKGEGHVWIRARVEVEDRPHRRASDPPTASLVVLTVEDDGPGIPEDVLPRIFDPFFTTKEVGEGTGLGLSICASILNAFGGDIRAENRPEGGASFVLHLRMPPPPPSSPV